MANHFVAVDVGGTKILAAAVTEDGAILARHKERTNRDSRKAMLDQLFGAIEKVIGDANLKTADLGGICLGVPGVVETTTGNVIFTPNAPLSKTPLGELIRKKFGVPTFIGNDVNLGTLGECWLGAARGMKSAFGIFVGTGIGGGLVIGDRLIEGHRGLGGEIGHLLIPLEAGEFIGASGNKHLFLEDLCSRTAIENQLRHAILNEGQTSVLTEIAKDPKLKRIRSGELKKALEKKDPLVTEVIRRSSYLLGLTTASVLHIVDPEVIVFGGGVIEGCGKWMLPVIEKTAMRVAMPGTGKKLRIEQSILGDDAIILGGVALLRHHTGRRGPLTVFDFTEAPKRPAVAVDKPLSE
jgi:glucokinase